jgi:hypothetical protein
LKRLEFGEEHRRGEVLVAGVMRAFLCTWVDRIKSLGDPRNADSLVGVERVAEEGADIAELLLTMAIRGIDYTPPIHISFGDFLSAILTADTEVRADDDRYNIRRHLKNEMAAYGIEPSSESDDGRWDPADMKDRRQAAAIRPAEAAIHACGCGGPVGGGIDVDPRRVRRIEIQHP